MSAGGAPVAATPPLRVVGKPPRLRGALGIDAGGTSVGAVDQDVALREDGGGELRGRLRLALRARPERQDRVRVRLAVDAATPPGVYRGTVVLGETSYALEAHVLERVNVNVAPSTVRLRAAAGDHVRTELVVSNEGNVEHALPRHAVVSFEESEWIGRAFVDALRDAAPEDGVQRYLDRVVRELRGTLAPTTTLTLEAPIATLPPGTETLLTLSGTLPTELAKGRTYVAPLRLAGRQLQLEIAVNGAGNSTKRRPA